MYFSKFPIINYSLDGGNTSFSITDIFRRVRAQTDNLLTSTAYDQYDIKEGETPEIIADQLYGNPALHWVILVSNEIIDPRFDWPLTSYALSKYITDKYGSGNEYGIHHYINSDGDVVHSSYAGTKYPVSNTDYEETVNEGKRRIAVIQPRFVSKFVESFNGLLNDG